mmetsp:Transcript_30559/g.79180  ORF Transcript_30559/g.79180 Transcript_30559/m.79180 type:complete len:441 (-) Transcript_30559:257-1579(-)
MVLELLLERIDHQHSDGLSADVGEVDQGLAHEVVHGHLVRILLLLPDDMAVLVFLDRHLRRFGHARHQDLPQLLQDWLQRIQLGPSPLHCQALGWRQLERAQRLHRPRGLLHIQHQGLRRPREVHRRVSIQHTHHVVVELVVEPAAEDVPELEANLEGLFVGGPAEVHEVLEGSCHHVRDGLDSCHVVLQKRSEHQCQLIVEDLPEQPLIRSVHQLGQLLHGRKHGNFVHHQREASHQVLVVLPHPTVIQGCDLVQALDAADAEIGGVPEALHKDPDEVGLKNESQRNPLHKRGQSVQSGVQQRILDGPRRGDVRLENEHAQLVNRLKLVAQRLLQLQIFPCCKIILPKIENLLADHRQDPQVVLTKCLVALPGRANVRDESCPLRRPLPLHDLYQGLIEFGQEVPLGPGGLLVGSEPHYSVHHVCLDGLLLLLWKCAPS